MGGPTETTCVGETRVTGKSSMPQGWLEWATRIQAIAQAGLAYAKDPFDRERYQSLRSLSLEIMEAHLQLQGEDERALLRELFASDTGYPTPKVDVRAFICQHDSVLLVKERADGRWALPGGWADLGRSPSEMAVREVAEEAGYEVRVKRLLSVWDENRHHASLRPCPSTRSASRASASVGLQAQDRRSLT